MSELEAVRYTDICKPQFEGLDKRCTAMDGKLDVLTKHLIIGNGKPSLLNRVDTLERCIEKGVAAPKDTRSLSIGKLIVLKGYGANDVIRIVIVVGVLWLVFEPHVSKFIK